MTKIIRVNYNAITLYEDEQDFYSHGLEYVQLRIERMKDAVETS